MANAALVITNLADAATTVVNANDFITSAPPAKLTDEHVGTKWRANVSSTYIIVDLATAQSFDTVMLAGVSGNVPVFRVRGSNTDPTGALGEQGDSGNLQGTPYFDPNYDMFVYLFSTTRTARYVRIDISEISPSVSFIEAGRLCIGLRQAFAINFQAPWRRVASRASIDTIGVGGQTFIDRRLGHWTVGASFNFVSQSERDGFLETLGVGIVNDGHKDLLWIKDPSSTNLSRDCVWGYLEGDLTVTQQNYFDPPFVVELTLRQRL